MSAIGVFISVFFLFVLLSARQAAVVVMVVASPIAVVLYALPNTKTLFRKWMKLFAGLLLVYPIAGLLVGSGGYVSKLLLATQATGDGAKVGFIWSFTAIMVSIMPVFFIPMLLKGSFSAMGKIGGSLANMGTAVSGGVKKGIRGTDSFKNAQERAREADTIRKGGLVRKADGSFGEKDVKWFGRFMRGGERNMARNRAQAFADEKRRREENRIMSQTGVSTKIAAMEAESEAQAVSDAGSLMTLGKIGENGKMMGDGGNAAVNINDVDSVSRFHSQALERYHDTQDASKRREIMAQIKAAPAPSPNNTHVALSDQSVNFVVASVATIKIFL